MLIGVFLVFLLHFLFVPFGRLRWLSVSFLLLVKYTVLYCGQYTFIQCIVTHQGVTLQRP